ncbi:MAG: hypothetical protein H6905_01820 [Hyphomicrobiales bacterium]|nr:hypothetical protein [Hyphomicrobiales bacterium]
MDRSIDWRQILFNQRNNPDRADFLVYRDFDRLLASVDDGQDGDWTTGAMCFEDVVDDVAITVTAPLNGGPCDLTIVDRRLPVRWRGTFVPGSPLTPTLANAAKALGDRFKPVLELAMDAHGQVAALRDYFADRGIAIEK